jgi:hypothetical protein
MREFGFSETFIREGTRRFLVLIPFLILFVVAFALYFSNFRIEMALVVIVGILLSLKERTSDRVLFKEKRWKLDWQNPFVGVLAGGVPAMVVMFIIASIFFLFLILRYADLLISSLLSSVPCLLYSFVAC